MKNILSEIVAGITNNQIRARLECWIANHDLTIAKLRKMSLRDLRYHLGPRSLDALYTELWSDARQMPWMTEFEAKANARLSPDEVLGDFTTFAEIDWSGIESCMEKITRSAKVTAGFIIAAFKTSRKSCMIACDVFPPQLEVKKRKHMLFLMNQRLQIGSSPFRFECDTNKQQGDIVEIVKKRH